MLIIDPYSMGKSNRQLWKDYVEGRSTAGSKTVDSARMALGKFRGIVLGIDPSLRATGLAVVEFRDGGQCVLHHRETIRVHRTLTSTECLAAISDRCEQVAEQFSIDQVAVEQTIYVQNFRTAMMLGTAKGAALGVLAKKGLPVFEYPPLRVKQAVVGNGRASKEQVAHMVSRFLNNAEWGGSDETDAAGVALCHGFTHRVIATI